MLADAHQVDLAHQFTAKPDIYILLTHFGKRRKLCRPGRTYDSIDRPDPLIHLLDRYGRCDIDLNIRI